MAVMLAVLVAACEPAAVERPLQYSSTQAPSSVPVYRIAVHPLHNLQLLGVVANDVKRFEHEVRQVASR
jgi:hypothetical protein